MNLKKLKLNPNWVLIKIDDSNEYIKLKDFKLFLDVSFEPEKNAQTIGTVIRTSPIFYSRKNIGSNPWKVPMELQEGDRVIFHFMAAKAAIKEGRCLVEDGEKYIIIPYDRLFVALRGDDVIPLNGIILIEPEFTGLKSDFIYIPESTQQVSRIKGVVKYLGAIVDEYREYQNMGGDLDEVKVGDTVMFTDINAIPLQWEHHSVLKKTLYRMHRMDILCTVN